jgi:uncharacterized membrane protein YeiH
LAEGAVIGISLALLESLVSLRWWLAFGRPDFLVRPNWIPEQIICYAIGGVVCGITFGAIVRDIALQRGARTCFLSLYITLMFAGAAWFIPLYYVMLRFRIPLFFVDDVALFVLGVVIARRMMKPNTAH